MRGKHAREPGARRWFIINNQTVHHPASSRRIWGVAWQHDGDAAATAGSVFKKNLRLAGVGCRQPLIDVPQTHAISIQLPHLKWLSPRMIRLNAPQINRRASRKSGAVILRHQLHDTVSATGPAPHGTGAD